MESRFKPGCFYCEHNSTQHERMLPIVTLDTATVFFNRDQTHPGRLIVALNWHVDELFELNQQQRSQFADEVSLVAKVIKKHFHASKINYGIYGDTVSHLHFHLVPKMPGDDDWDDAFVNNPEQPLYLDDKKNEALIEELRVELEEAYETIKN